jgi:protein-tyrosine phosphatase
MPLRRLFNFRDLGGLACVDGRRVRAGRFYRSDGLWKLTGDEVTGLGIRTVLDLRRPDEIAADGRVAAAAGLSYHHVDLHPDPWPQARLGHDEIARYLADRYAEMAELALSSSASMARCLRLLADAQAGPVVVHSWPRWRSAWSAWPTR